MAIFSASASFIPAKIDTRLPTDQRDNIRSLPELIEHNARHNPNHIFCVQARKKSSTELARPGLLEVTHLQLKTAIIQCSRWLVAHVGELRRPHKDGDSDKIIRGPPIALFMESDIGILIHLFSLLSLGVPVRKHMALKYKPIHQLIRRR
jgi:acyl-CoA synthetase (AMP-forming)/AMP-acid ligase II